MHGSEHIEDEKSMESILGDLEGRLAEMDRHVTLGRWLEDSLLPGVTVRVEHTADDDYRVRVDEAESGDVAVVESILRCDQLVKRCKACARVLPLTKFSLLKGSKDGRNRYCRQCERERVANHKRRCCGRAAGFPPPRPGGHVYFVAARDRVKIGQAKDVRRRVGELQAHCPEALTLLATLPGANKENGLHRKFARYRLHGEWFAIEGELKDHLGDLIVSQGGIPRLLKILKGGERGGD